MRSLKWLVEELKGLDITLNRRNGPGFTVTNEIEMSFVLAELHTGEVDTHAGMNVYHVAGRLAKYTEFGRREGGIEWLLRYRVWNWS